MIKSIPFKQNFPFKQVLKSFKNVKKLSATSKSPSQTSFAKPNFLFEENLKIQQLKQTEHSQINIKSTRSYSNINIPAIARRGSLNYKYQSKLSSKNLHSKFSIKPKNRSFEDKKQLKFKKNQSLHETKNCNRKNIYLGNKKFSIIKKLGEGKYGKVVLAVQSKTGFIVAIKIMNKNKLIENNLLNQLIRELKIQTFLNNPNIIKIFGSFCDIKNFYILMELGSDGQLYNYMQKQSRMNQPSSSFIIKNLLIAVNYLHLNNVIHRDIKPQNIVVVHGNIKLCDFGWAVHLNKQLRSTYCGTPLYFSPQLLKGKLYDQKVDIWAIGILTFELLTGKSPFTINEYDEIYKIVTDQIEFPENYICLTKHFKDFVKAILKKNPLERLNCQQLLQMKFIKKYDQMQTCQQLCQ